jgi:dTDP-4-dehydrorhamnose reductase
MKPLIAVSGKNGQLGWELQRLSSNYPQYDFIFCDRHELDITNDQQVDHFFQVNKPQFFINTAAYTGVDKAETDQAACYDINARAVGQLAAACKRYDTVFITFSSDYVFNGNATQPYVESDPIDPVNYYGFTKAKGEKLAFENWEKTIVIRTSWVYSSHGNNFIKTMLRLMKERTSVNVVNDQVGSPTFAGDLAEAVLQLIGRRLQYGTYHFSNEGEISWYDFAAEIKRISGLHCAVNPIPTTGFPTPAKRPAYSVLDQQKIASTFDLRIKDWKTSLEKCLQELLNNNP